MTNSQNKYGQFNTHSLYKALKPVGGSALMGKGRKLADARQFEVTRETLATGVKPQACTAWETLAVGAIGVLPKQIQHCLPLPVRRGIEGTPFDGVVRFRVDAQGMVN